MLLTDAAINPGNSGGALSTAVANYRHQFREELLLQHGNSVEDGLCHSLQLGRTHHPSS
jgi:hypothetical protein